MTDTIAEKINVSPQARARWFQKAGLLHTLEEHTRENTRRAAELRRSIAERTDWTPVTQSPHQPVWHAPQDGLPRNA
jgi:hypothetical protein